jgi:hypothetical protein
MTDSCEKNNKGSRFSNTITDKLKRVKHKISTDTQTITRTITKKLNQVKETLYDSTEMVKLPRMKTVPNVPDSSSDDFPRLEFRPSSWIKP